MPNKEKKMHPNKMRIQYITDKDGNKTDVVLPLQEYQELMEDIKDLAIVAEKKNEETVSHDEVIAKLKADGLI